MQLGESGCGWALQLGAVLVGIAAESWCTRGWAAGKICRWVVPIEVIKRTPKSTALHLMHLRPLSLPPPPTQDPDNRALPIEDIKRLMRREKNKKMAAFSRTKNVLHVSQLEEEVGRLAFWKSKKIWHLFYYLAAFSRSKNMLHVTQLEEVGGGHRRRWAGAWTVFVFGCLGKEQGGDCGLFAHTPCLLPPLPTGAQAVGGARVAGHPAGAGPTPRPARPEGAAGRRGGLQAAQAPRQLLGACFPGRGGGGGCRGGSCLHKS